MPPISRNSAPVTAAIHVLVPSGTREDTRMHRKREEELGAPAEAALVRIRKSVFVVGWTSDARNLHWSALVI